MKSVWLYSAKAKKNDEMKLSKKIADGSSGRLFFCGVLCGWCTSDEFK